MPPHSTNVSFLNAAAADLTESLGALEIGVFVSIFMFGIVTAQVYSYYTRFSHDTPGLKVLVMVVWILDLGHTICISHSTYTSSVVFNGMFNQIPTFPSLYASVLFGSTITLHVQLFFAYRVWKLVGVHIASFCFVLSVLRFIASIVVASEAFSLPTFRAYEEKMGWLVIALFVVGTVVDTLISSSLCWVLMKKRRENAFASTRTVIDAIMVWAIQTGLATSVMSILLVITLVTMPNNFIWICVYVLLAKLYSNSLLASLNSRIKLRETLGTNTASGHSERPFSARRPIEIMQSTEVEIDSDVFNQAKYEMQPRDHPMQIEERNEGLKSRDDS